jgi:hypothetical protein
MVASMAIQIIVVFLAGCDQAAPQVIEHSQATVPRSTLQKYSVKGAPKVLAKYSTGTRVYYLERYESEVGQPCAAVYSSGSPIIPACAIPLTPQHPINAALLNMNSGVWAAYGAVSINVTRVYSVSTSGQQIEVKLLPASSTERFFLVIDVNGNIRNIVAIAHSMTFSLRNELQKLTSTG